MKSNSPRWVWATFIVAILTIGYAMIPPAAVMHAAAMWGWG